MPGFSNARARRQRLYCVTCPAPTNADVVVDGQSLCYHHVIDWHAFAAAYRHAPANVTMTQFRDWLTRRQNRGTGAAPNRALVQWYNDTRKALTRQPSTPVVITTVARSLDDEINVHYRLPVVDGELPA